MDILRELRIKKGYETDISFANHLGVKHPHYSMINSGKKPLSAWFLERLQECYPGEEFPELVAIMKKSEFENKGNATKIATRGGSTRPCPIVNVTDRLNICTLEQNKFQGLGLIAVSTTLFKDNRSGYFVVIGANEPFASDLISPGDSLLCYTVDRKQWVNAVGMVMIVLKSCGAQIVKIDSNNLWQKDDQNITTAGAPGKRQVIQESNIKSIFKIESIIYRQL